jgi:hypothetical protein
VFVQPHNLHVTQAFLSSRCELLPGSLEEMEPVIQLAFDESPLAHATTLIASRGFLAFGGKGFIVLFLKT